MKICIQIIGVLIIIAGLVLLISPNSIFGWLEDNYNSKGFYFAAIGFRLILGGLLLYTARESRYPLAMKIIGLIALIAALSFIFIGFENFQQIIESIMPDIRPFAPIGSIIGLFLGCFLFYAFKAPRGQI